MKLFQIGLANFAPLPPVLSNLLGTVVPVLYGLALAWFGYDLMTSGVGEEAAQAQPISSSSQVTA